MADDFVASAGTADGATFAADDVSGKLHTRVKPTWGADGTGNDTNLTTPLPVQVVATVNGGCTPYHLVAANTANLVSVKGSAGVLYGINVTSKAGEMCWVKLFDQAGVPDPSADSGNVKLNFGVPIVETTGAGFTQDFSQGVTFASGIGISVTGAPADNDETALTAASEVVVNLWYK